MSAAGRAADSAVARPRTASAQEEAAGGGRGPAVRRPLRRASSSDGAEAGCATGAAAGGGRREAGGRGGKEGGRGGEGAGRSPAPHPRRRAPSSAPAGRSRKVSRERRRPPRPRLRLGVSRLSAKAPRRAVFVRVVPDLSGACPPAGGRGGGLEGPGAVTSGARPAASSAHRRATKVTESFSATRKYILAHSTNKMLKWPLEQALTNLVWWLCDVSTWPGWTVLSRILLPVHSQNGHRRHVAQDCKVRTRQQPCCFPFGPVQGLRVVAGCPLSPVCWLTSLM
ncbi:translation initiation factor IF-2-like [Nycticebus coucang]|uniref:translation initiation factor IF-2-like n=1 Tax=Nycticebus coucang TaxID=9470 RepID=UPI00234E1BEA|nr:translation initiation factor IF-2-like [Nycticebus coucang]